MRLHKDFRKGNPLPFPRSVAIFGVGLIGGSIAAALRKRAPETDVIGIGRDGKRLQNALEAGLLTGFATSTELLSNVDTVIVCTPVDRVAEAIRQVKAHTSADTVFTDAGSVKESICRELKYVPNFVGSHPLAGSEQSGWENADADLYEGRTCIITPEASSDLTAVRRVRDFWTELGMSVVDMTPAEHDLAVAQTSHLPHIAAAAVARQLRPKYEALVARGFRDTTRVAAGDAEMWTAITKANASAIMAQIDEISSDLQRLRDSVQNDDRAAIHDWFANAAAIRERLTFDHKTAAEVPAAD